MEKSEWKSSLVQMEQYTVESLRNEYIQVAVFNQSDARELAVSFFNNNDDKGWDIPKTSYPIYVLFKNKEEWNYEINKNPNFKTIGFNQINFMEQYTVESLRGKDIQVEVNSAEEAMMLDLENGYDNPTPPNTASYPIYAYFKEKGNTRFNHREYYEGFSKSQTIKFSQIIFKDKGMVEKKLFTIQDIANSNCDILNDGTYEDLCSVLHIAFPSYKNIVIGGGRFYGASLNNSEIWRSALETKRPTQSVKEFLKQIEKKVENDMEKKLFTIQDLANGLCDAKNYGTYEELCSVLSIAFPSDTNLPKGEADIYGANTKNFKKWIAINTTNRPIQSVKDFFKQIKIKKADGGEKKLFTIQDIANGDCDVENDGTYEELVDVLMRAFTNSMLPSGKAKFYGKNPLNSFNWIESNETNRPTQSVKEFWKQIDFEKEREISVESKYAVKPPIGLMPEWAWKQERAEAIIGATKRYMDAGKQVPNEWVIEYNKLIKNA